MFRRTNRIVTTGSAVALAAVAVVTFVPTGADASIPAPGSSVSAATSFGRAGGPMPAVVQERQTAKKLTLRFYVPFVTGDIDVRRLRHGKIVETCYLEDLFGACQQLIAK